MSMDFTVQSEHHCYNNIHPVWWQFTTHHVVQFYIHSSLCDTFFLITIHYILCSTITRVHKSLFGTLINIVPHKHGLKIEAVWHLVSFWLEKLSVKAKSALHRGRRSRDTQKLLGFLGKQGIFCLVILPKVQGVTFVWQTWLPKIVWHFFFRVSFHFVTLL